MSVPVDVLQNALMGLRPLAKLAQRYHSTGLNADPDMVSLVFNLYSRFASMSGKDILEIGPGHTLEVLEKAKASGAKSCTAIDVIDYLPPEQVREKQIAYAVYDGKEMPLAAESVDLICSYTALEHVRYPSMTVQECFRILRPGGRLVSVIDLGDHSCYGKNESYPDRVFDCLRYPDWLCCATRIATVDGNAQTVLAHIHRWGCGARRALRGSINPDTTSTPTRVVVRLG